LSSRPGLDACMLPFDGGEEYVSLLSRRLMTSVRLAALISSGTPNSTPAQWQALALDSSQGNGGLRVKQIDKKGTRDADILSYIWGRSHLSWPFSADIWSRSHGLSQPRTPASRSIRSLRHAPTETEPSRLFPGHTSFIGCPAARGIHRSSVIHSQAPSRS
jgi:hypothetical protein